MADEKDGTEGFTVYTEEPLNLEEAKTESDDQDEDLDPNNPDESETSGEEDTKPKGEEPKEGKARYQKRIDKLVKQREDAEREKYELQEELRLLKGSKSEPQKTSVKIDPLDYENYDDYLAALDTQDSSSEKKDTPKENKPDAAVPPAEAKVYRMLEDSFEESRELHEDFDATVRDDSVPFTFDMLAIISELDNAGEVTYFLAKNKDEVKRISGLSATKQAIELGKVSDKVEATPLKAAPKTTKAADPIAPVTPKSGGVEKDPSKMDFKEYEAHMNAQNKKPHGKFW